MDDLETWLRLSLTNGIGAVGSRRLLSTYNDSREINSAGTARLRNARFSQAQAEAFLGKDLDTAVEETLRWAEQENHHLLAFGSADYPQRLAHIHDAPPVLYVIGDKDVLKTPQLAIVGSRKPSPDAARTAREFATGIAARGLTITSGLALGIDGEAHQGSLDAHGLTIAVVATGLDRVYPAKHRELAYRIVQTGAMVSEFALGTPVRTHYFARRNRIISGLSIGTLVVEAAVRSRSLTTARHATEQGRQVLAIPGSIHNPVARGCHQLIRQGAKLVETVDDILEELAGQIGDLAFLLPSEDAMPDAVDKMDIAKNAGFDPDYQKLLECIDYSPKSINLLIDRSGLPASEVASMLLILEMEGLVQAVGANRYLRC